MPTGSVEIGGMVAVPDGPSATLLASVVVALLKVSVTVTVPVNAPVLAPVVTVTVNVTPWPKFEGFGFEVIVVIVVFCGAASPTTSITRGEFAVWPVTSMSSMSGSPDTVGAKITPTVQSSPTARLGVPVAQSAGAGGAGWAVLTSKLVCGVMA